MEIQPLGCNFNNNVDITPPSFTSDNKVSVNEKQLSAISLHAIDDDSVTYTISGTDSDSFNVDGQTGVVTFKSLPNYNTKNAYTFIAHASDSNENSESMEINIDIIKLQIDWTTATLSNVWTKSFGASNTGDYGSGTILTNDNAVITLGYLHNLSISNPQGGNDTFVKKYSKNGTLIWSVNIGNASTDNGQQIIQTEDNGYLIAGESSTNSWSAILTKISSSGVIEWQNEYKGNTYSRSYSVIEDSDGNIVLSRHGGILGSNDKGAVLVKISSIGNTIWTKSYGWCQSDYPYKIIESSDGNYIMAGYTYCSDAKNNNTNNESYSSSAEDYAFAIKISKSGNELWKKSYVNFHTAFFDIDETPQNHLLFTGTHSDTDSSANNAWIVKTDLDGSLIWQKKYNYYGANETSFVSDAASSLVIANDGDSYIFSGCTGNQVQYEWNCRNTWLSQVSKDGEVEWSKKFVGSSNDTLRPISSIVFDLETKSIFFTGTINSDWTFSKYNLEYSE